MSETDHVDLSRFRMPRQKTMILLESGAARRIWEHLHQQGGGYWMCGMCGGMSRANRPSIKHDGWCPVPELYARLPKRGFQ